MHRRCLFFAGSLLLLGLAGPAHAALSTTPVFLQQHILGLTRFVEGTDTAGTYKTLYTPTSTHGAKCYSFRVTNTDNVVAHVVTVQLERTAVQYGGTALLTALNAGFDPAVPPQDLLTPARWPGLAADSDGNRYFYVANGDSVRATFATALTTGKEIQMQLICVEF